MRTSVFYLPSIGSREEIEAGLAGLRPELYQRMLAELSEQAKLADRLGYASIAFTEHHFHVEGFELSNNPVMLDLFLAMQTERIAVGQLGIVLPSQNPIRVAEDIAMLDHMSAVGRMRGSRAATSAAGSTRWRSTSMASTARRRASMTRSTPPTVRRSRSTSASSSRPGRRTSCRTRATTGRSHRRALHGTSTPHVSGAVASDDDNIVRQVAVVPKPLQRPHPPIFQPFASSERSIRWCAQEGVTAILPPMNLELQHRLFEVYREEAAAAGRDLAPGEGLGVLRDVVVADTDEEAMALWRHGGAFCGAAWFSPFHFGEVLKDPQDGHQYTPEEMMERGLLLVGSPDTVAGQVERMLEDTPVQWIFAWQYNGLVPHASMLRSIEAFATDVLPRFGGLD